MNDSLLLTAATAEKPAIDDCWNRIGVHGDKSCERLVEHVHCHNCERYAAAAILLLDRYALVRDVLPDAGPLTQTDKASGPSTLIFRLGDEWLALPSAHLLEVVAIAPIHSLPHPRSPALLGVSNVRGTLVACLSLSSLLGLDPGTSVIEGRRVVPRMLVFAAEGGPLVAPVDEVLGIHRVPTEAIRGATRNGAQAASQYAKGVLRWQERSLTLLDDNLLLQAMARSLA